MGGQTITKRDLTLRLSEVLGINQNMARDILQLIIDEITNELAEGNRVELRDFGIFEIKNRPPRRARNPKDGSSVHVPARRTVHIKPGKKMVDRINEAMPISAEETEAKSDQG